MVHTNYIFECFIFRCYYYSYTHTYIYTYILYITVIYGKRIKKQAREKSEKRDVNWQQSTLYWVGGEKREPKMDEEWYVDECEW